MAGQQTVFRRAKSIAGEALIGIGLFSLYQNLADAVMRLRHVLNAGGTETPGVSPALIEAALQLLQAYSADHHRFLECVLLRMLISSWPLLLVMIGTVLSRDSFMGDVNTLPAKD